MRYFSLIFTNPSLNPIVLFFRYQDEQKKNYDNPIAYFTEVVRQMTEAQKERAFAQRNRFSGKMDFSLDDVYRSLSFFTKFKDELRRKGVSEEHRPDPIIQMGLFMDTDGIPLTYRLDKQTLVPMIRKIRKDYTLGCSIIAAGEGMTVGDNMRQILLDRNGYVLSYSIRVAKASFKDYVLQEDGYCRSSEGFKIKSRIYPREITVSTLQGTKQKLNLCDSLPKKRHMKAITSSLPASWTEKMRRSSHCLIIDTRLWQMIDNNHEDLKTYD